MDVIEVIAAGGFGRVERVRVKPGHECARKVFHPREDLATGADIEKLKKRFAREIRVQSQLPSEFFIPVLEHGLGDDPPWFLMPLAETTLEHAMQDVRRDHKATLFALGNILDSLQHLHSLDYVHRDLKPSNILLHEGRWKLTDFGLVLPLTSESTKLSTKLSAWGTIGYCAPEQSLQFGNATASADIFSMGCILHDLFGDGQRVPFARLTCAGPMGAIIERCTEYDPARRFRSLDGLRAAVFDVLAAPQAAQSSPEATELAAQLENIEGMTSGALNALVRLVRNAENLDRVATVFTSLNEERLTALHGRDPVAWQEIANRYCEWARGGFNFEYCDVIAGRLQTIFQLGTVAMKSTAILAAASLARSHNRWYVMGKVLEMCGPGLDEAVAQRVCIEIRAEEQESDFLRCAVVIHQEVSRYHPSIARIVEEYEKRTS